jgi:hypothetical protein
MEYLPTKLTISHEVGLTEKYVILLLLIHLPFTHTVKKYVRVKTRQYAKNNFI